MSPTSPTRISCCVRARGIYDVSAIDDSEMDLQAATLLACWSAGFGTVNVANTLADAGLEPRRHYFVVLGELWRALRAGRGMVDRVDALTRLNRQRGVGMAMISHTMSDLLALPAGDDVRAAIREPGAHQQPRATHPAHELAFVARGGRTPADPHGEHLTRLIRAQLGRDARLPIRAVQQLPRDPLRTGGGIRLSGCHGR